MSKLEIRRFARDPSKGPLVHPWWALWLAVWTCTSPAYDQHHEHASLSSVNTHDLLFSPSFRKPSTIFNISFLPAAASTFLPPILILTFSFAWASNSLFSSKWRICMHTKTPQSLLFSCCGESVRSINFNSLPVSRSIFRVAVSASCRLDEFRLS